MPYTYIFDLFKDSDDTSVSGFTGISLTGTSLSVTGLTNNTGYYWKVKRKYTSIYGTEIISAYSDRSDVTTLNFSGVGETVSGTVSEINYEQFIFNFNRYPLPTYRITVAQDGLPLSDYTSILVTGTTISVTGLTNNLSYDVSVNISYKALEEVETYTQTIPELLPPSSVTGTAITSSGFTATWTNASGVTQNNFTLFNSSGIVSGYDSLTVVGSSLNVTGLVSSTLYNFFAKSLYNGQESGFSNTALITTASAGSAPTVPTGVAVSGVINTSGMVYWSSSPTATGYSGEYSANNFVTGTTFTTTGTSFSMTPLAENTSYKVRVKASNQFGESAFSSEVSFKTKIKQFLVQSNDGVARSYFYTTTDLVNFTKLTANNSYAEDAQVRYRQDGQKIGYSRNTASGKYHVFVYDVATGIETQLTTGAVNDYDSCTWNIQDNNHIYCVKNPVTAGSKIVKINISTGVETDCYTSSQIADLDFSTDGVHAIFRDGSNGIYRTRFSDWVAINTPLINNSPFTVATGFYNRLNNDILFSALTGGQYDIYRVDVSTPTTKVVLSNFSGNEFVTAQDIYTNEIYYYWSNAGDLEAWKFSSDYSTKTKVLDRDGNRDIVKDICLIQLP